MRVSARGWRQDVVEQQKELNQAQRDLASARTEYAMALEARVRELDARIAEAAKDPKADHSALTAKRNDLNAKVDAVRHATDEKWEAAKADLDTAWDDIERSFSRDMR